MSGIIGKRFQRLVLTTCHHAFLFRQSAASLYQQPNPIRLIIISLPICRVGNLDSADRLIFIPLIKLPILTTHAALAELDPSSRFKINLRKPLLEMVPVCLKIEDVRKVITFATHISTRERKPSNDGHHAAM
jgi:hypothetical protein